MSTPRGHLAICLAATCYLAFMPQSHADDGTWTTNGNGNWSDIANWNSGTGPIASGADFTATLADIITNNYSITNDGRTIGNIVVLDSSHNYTISSGTLTLDVTAGSPTLTVPTGRTLTISSVVAGNDGFTKNGDGTVTMSSVNTVTGDVIVNGGLVNFDSNNLTLNSLSGSGDFFREEKNSTLTILDASGFTGNLATFAGGNSSHTIQFQSISDAVGAGNLITRGGSGDSNQITKFRLYGDTGPVTFDNRAIEILSRQSTPRNWSSRGTRLDNDNSTPANAWVINTDLINETDRNHELILMGNNTGDNTFAGVIGDSTGIGGLGAFYSTQTGALTLIKDEAGKWILRGANTYTGNTIISNGTLEIRGAGQLGGGNYAGNIINNDSTPSPFTFGSSANQTISGNISGTMEFIKDGSGTLSLSGATNHTGNTTVNNGTLALGDGTENTGISDFSTLAVASGAMLDLNFATGNPDAVIYLSLGGINLPAGQYGHTNSGASNGGAGIGAYDAYFADNTGIINNLGGNIASLNIAFWDGGNSDIGTDGNAASAGGSGIWDDSTLNWDIGFTSHTAWFNTASSTANFGGTSGTVTLGADMDVGTLIIDLPSAGGNGYSIGSADEDNTLTFGGDKLISITANGNGTNNNHTFRAGIAGSPTLNITGANNNSYYFALEPTANVTMTLGTLNLYNTLASNKQLRLGGQSNGNVVDKITWSVTNNQLQVRKQDTSNGGADGSSWTVNQDISIDDGRIYVDEGTLIVGGTNNFVSHSFEVQSGGRAVLSGNWRIHDENEDFRVLSGGYISPGPGIATATFNWNSSRGDPSVGLVDLQTGSTYEWQIGAANSTDVIALTEPVSGGNAELVVASGTKIKVINSGGTPSASDQLTVFTYDVGVVTPDTTTLNANVTIDISETGYSGTPTLVNDGAGTIYITGLTAPSPYDNWAAGTFTNAFTQTLPTENQDGDAFTNLMEFAFGMDPTVSNSDRLGWDGSTLTKGGPTVFHNFEAGGGVTFKARFMRRTDHGNSGSVNYVWRFSSDLTDWEDSDGVPAPPWLQVPAVVTTDGDYQLVEVPYPFFLSTSKKARFFQVKVTEVP